MDLEKMKTALRIFHNKLDEEILFNIEVCKKDMKRVGITKIKDDDPLIEKLEELYLKW